MLVQATKGRLDIFLLNRLCLLGRHQGLISGLLPSAAAYAGPPLVFWTSAWGVFLGAFVHAARAFALGRA